MSPATSTIQLKKKLINDLREVKDYERQTYNELLGKMISVYKALKERNQYDEFLHRIQQPKMKELWDNEEDGEWDNV